MKVSGNLHKNLLEKGGYIDRYPEKNKVIDVAKIPGKIDN